MSEGSSGPTTTVAEHEPCAGRELGSDALEEVGLPGAVEVVDGERRDDDVKRALRERILQARDA